MKLITEYHEDKTFPVGTDEEMTPFMEKLIVKAQVGTIELYYRVFSKEDAFIHGFLPMGHNISLAHDKFGRRMWLEHKFQNCIGEMTSPIFVISEQQIKVFDQLFSVWKAYSKNVTCTNSAVYDAVMGG